MSNVFSKRTTWRRDVSAACAIAVCLWAIFSPASGVGATLPASAPPFAVPDAGQLGGKERFLLLLSTDKPVYKPGETLYARAVILRQDSFFPVQNHPGMRISIAGPRGNELAANWTSVQNSTAGFAWAVPRGASGGRYKASVTVDGQMTAERDFEIRVYNPPRLRSQIEFLRDGYGPGDTVTAAISVKRAEGGAPEGARLTAVARIDGAEVARVEDLRLDKDGNARASFALPKTMERGEGALAFIIEDGGVLESAGKTIPILLRTLDLSFYPESGELVAGLPARVYAQALRPDGKPADIRGEVVLLDEKEEPHPLSGPSTLLVTAHEGRGTLEFTPRAKERYALRLSEPSGIAGLFPLPPVRASGAVIRAEKPAYAFAEDVTLGIDSTRDADAAWVTLYHRERLVAQAALTAGHNKVALKPGEAEGVLMATVWDTSGRPLAERLIFREPKFKVHIGVRAESVPGGAAHVPGGRVRLQIETRDDKGNPVEAVVGLAVTDDAVLEMTEKRDQAPSLPVMVYLENEVRDLADAHVYFDPENPDAARRIDLLLGTQGWRRFVLSGLDEALKNNPEATRRALAILSPRPIAPPKALRLEANVAMAPPRNIAMAPPRKIPPEEQQEIPPGQVEWPLDDGMAAAEEIALPGQMEMAKPAEPPREVLIREYAHKARSNRRPGDRVDFAETVYWNAGIRTNPRDGSASVEFDLSDSVTTFRLRADAFGTNGALGETSCGITSLEPFFIEPKLPPQVLAGDKVHLPVALVNSMPQPLEGPNLLVRAEGLKPGVAKMPARLSADSRPRVLLDLEPTSAGEYPLNLSASAGGYADSVTRSITVLPRGFPVRIDASGLLGPQKPFSRSFGIAADIAPGSMRAEAKIYPSPLANMEEALNALLRSPYGCFEQTSSISFPLVMAQQYFLSHAGVSPEKIKQAGKLLDESYKRLIGFESRGKGYEWFGGDPGHEALTAYGLMQFTEMRDVAEVDAAMIERTRAWLMSRRDGQGGFKRNPKALDSFGAAPSPLTNLYILWTLLESGEKPSTLQAEISAAKKLVSETKDPYLLALGANVMHLAGERASADAAAKKLQGMQEKDGSLSGAETSITRSGGEALRIETTSLAVIAWLRLGDGYAGAVEPAMGWLFERCKAGRFGSTQSTILALKAINAYDAARAKPGLPGRAQLKIDGKPFGAPVSFDADSKGALALPDFSAALSPGDHAVELAMEGGVDMPFVIAITYNTEQPDNGAQCPLTLATSLSAATIREGELVDLRVSVTARADTSMPLAVIGLPAGLEPGHERLRELTAAGQIASYEINGRELTLYWRVMRGGTRTDLSIPCIAAIPGVYAAPASRAYAFYLDEHKFWASGERIEIVAK